MLAVLLFHLNASYLVGGFVGVDVFFVLSGFLITSLLVAERGANGRVDLANFYQRRIARLMPALFLVLAVTLFLASRIYSDQDLASAGANATAAALSVANFKQLLQGSYFDLSRDAQPLLHCWSLSIEEQFYMLFPAMLIVLYRFLSGPRAIAMVLVAFALASLALSIALSYQAAQWAFYLPLTRAWELLAGCVLAITLVNGRPKLPRATGWVALAVVLGSFVLIDADQTAFPGWVAMVPVAATLVLLASFSSQVGSGVTALLSMAPLPQIGRLSYSLYLWHWPIYSFIDYRFFQETEFYRTVLKLVIVVAVSLLAYYGVERPLRSLLHRQRWRVATFAGFFVFSASLAAAGWSVRDANYIATSPAEIADGGRVVNPQGTHGTLALLGDSQASMYAKTLAEFAQQHDFRLVVMTVNGEGVLAQTRSWDSVRAVLEREQPQVVLIANLWDDRLQADGASLHDSLEFLQSLDAQLVLLAQPPRLPVTLNRESIRNGAPKAQSELESERLDRERAQRIVGGATGPGVTVVEVAALFLDDSGQIRFVDDHGHQLFHDRTHLSGLGAQKVIERMAPLLLTRPAALGSLH